MNLTNLRQSSGEFTLLETTGRSQSALLRLPPGQAASDAPQAHPESDQVLLLLEGELSAEIAAESTPVHPGDSLTIPAGIKHKFTNPGAQVAVAYSVYAPPAFQTDDPS